MEKMKSFGETARIIDRIYLTNNNKRILVAAMDGARVGDESRTADVIERVTVSPLCVACGRKFQYGLVVKGDNSAMCIDCADEHNYVDGVAIKLCQCEEWK